MDLRGWRSGNPLGQCKEAEESESGKPCRQVCYSHLGCGSSAELSGRPEPHDGCSFEKRLTRLLIASFTPRVIDGRQVKLGQALLRTFDFRLVIVRLRSWSACQASC